MSEERFAIRSRSSLLAGAEGGVALSVGELTARIKELLEGSFDRVRVEGEIVGLSRPGSGHVYFSLKDSSEELGRARREAKLAAVLWRSQAARLRIALEDGLRVTASGRLTVYEPRGAYQLVVDSLRPAGRGALLQALERLKRKLWEEGLFAPERKRPLPFLPRRVGVVTSAGGAALRDVLRSLHRKFPVSVRLFPARVQGEGSAGEIVAALERLRHDPGCIDVLIIARGGGSLEDLWTFNEESVVRAVSACPVPTVSGVGHEVDTTLVDLAADVRAQTPTHAGDLVVPSFQELAESVEGGLERLLALHERVTGGLRDELDQWQRRLLRASPSARIRRLQESLDSLVGRLRNSLYNRFRQWEDQLLVSREKLVALDPHNVLERGFAVVRAADGSIVRSVGSVSTGEELSVLLAEGELDVNVRGIRDGRAARRASLDPPDSPERA